MTRSFWITTALLLALTGPAEAQLFGGGGLIVFDPTNFTKNQITAAQMLLQVANSNREVAMMLQNLIGTSGSYYEMQRYLALLREVIDTGADGAKIHYYGNTEADMLAHYPGYARTDDWHQMYGWLTDTLLNTQRGMLNTVHEELQPEDDARVAEVEAELVLKTEAAQGNLDVSQAGNYLAILQVDELRRQRHMLGALTNALTVAQSHTVNLQAAAEKAAHVWLETSQAPVLPYSGAGGVRTIPPIQ